SMLPKQHLCTKCGKFHPVICEESPFGRAAKDEEIGHLQTALRAATERAEAAERERDEARKCLREAGDEMRARWNAINESLAENRALAAQLRAARRALQRPDIMNGEAIRLALAALTSLPAAEPRPDYRYPKDLARRHGELTSKSFTA